MLASASAPQWQPRQGANRLLHRFAMLLGVCAFIMVVVGVPTTNATSYSEALIGVDTIQLWIHADTDESTSGLVDVSKVRTELVEYLTHALAETRPDIRIESSIEPGTPELMDVEQGTLQIIFSLTIKQNSNAAGSLPCCLGAIAMRLDRDVVRPRKISELVYSEDFYRLNWPPRPLLFEDEPAQAGEQVVQAGKSFLKEVLEALAELPPN